MRHLVLEGPDGGGKTRLAEAIFAKFKGLVPGQKASHSLKGPVKNLAAWVTREFLVMDGSVQPIVYDRHPVISEPIYGRIARDEPQPGFSPSPWLSTQRLKLQERAYVIWCIPPLEQVMKGLTDNEQMPGVVDNIEALHQAYLNTSVNWNGPGIRYDYSSYSMWPSDATKDQLFPSAVKFVEEYMGVFGA